MTRVLMLPIVAALALASGSASAQQPPQPQTMPPSMTNCHTPGTTGSAPVKENDGKATGKATGNAQDIEKSAILPSTGGNQESAAPTVQRDGKSVEARTDCPDDPNTPKPKG